jgi:hypothetical protein
VRWSLNFKTSGTEKYDRSTNPTKWFEVYQLTIKAAEGDSYFMANYLPVYLSASARTWLLGLPTRSIHSWNHLHQLFSSNFCTTSAQSGVDWDLASIIQKKGESLWEFIQWVCNKRNIFLEVDDKSIVMFFKKELRDSSLIRKLAMKNPRTSEEMFTIANKYALAEEVILDTREQKKESGHTYQPSSSKGHKRRGKLSILSIRWNGYGATRSTDLGLVNLKDSWIASAFSPLGKAQDPGL